MNNFSLQSLYYKTIIKSNFINISTNWIITKNSSFDKILISFQCNPKKYNKKMFVLLIMLMEFITRGANLSKKKIHFLSKNKKNSLKININYILYSDKTYIFFDNFINDFFWLDFDIFQKPINNKIIISTNNPKVLYFYINKILDLTNFIQNKIQFEKYFLKKKYKLALYFLPSHQLYYSWWTKSIGFHNFKNENNL